MAWFRGHAWKIWIELRLTGVITVKDGELVWPKKVKRTQVLVHVGERHANEPALITCEGRCSNGTISWTIHRCVKGASYECTVCEKTRRWGLDLW